MVHIGPSDALTATRRSFLLVERWLAAFVGIEFPHDELISIPSDLPLPRTLQKELSQQADFRLTDFHYEFPVIDVCFCSHNGLNSDIA